MSSSMSNRESRVPWRTLLLASAAVVCAPAGHIAAPIGLFFLRFLDAQYRTRPADWLILSLVVLGMLVSLVSWRRKRLSVALGAGALYFAVVALAVSEWSSPLDLPITSITALPFAGIVASIAWRCATARDTGNAAAPGETGTPKT